MTTATVVMLIAGWIPVFAGNHVEFREAWHAQREVTAEVCLEMTQLARADKAGALIVTCTLTGEARP